MQLMIFSLNASYIDRSVVACLTTSLRIGGMSGCHPGKLIAEKSEKTCQLSSIRGQTNYEV